MDTQQIEQQMRERRATIDAKLDLLTRSAASAWRRGLPAVLGMAGAVAGLAAWSRRRGERRRSAR